MKLKRGRQEPIQGCGAGMHQTVVHSVDSIYADSVDGMQIEQWMVMIQVRVSLILSHSLCVPLSVSPIPLVNPTQGNVP